MQLAEKRQCFANKKTASCLFVGKTLSFLLIHLRMYLLHMSHKFVIFGCKKITLATGIAVTAVLNIEGAEGGRKLV